ncbi:hypothetical protein AAHH79_39330, partial [Burkholderia pseudomallei]
MTITRIQSNFAMTRCERLRPGRSFVIGLLLCEFAPHRDKTKNHNISKTPQNTNRENKKNKKKK